MKLTQRLSKRFRRLLVRSLATELDLLKINQAKTWLQHRSNSASSELADYDYKVFSQWGDDGIIQFLINRVQVEDATFIEFGVEDFQESNCRFLMMHNNWSGFIMDGSEKKLSRTRGQNYYWQHDLIAKAVFITQENINALLDESGFGDRPGIISIDIDGVDYWIFKQIRHRPALFIVEYNAVFGAERAITVPYKADFERGQAHHSNLYYGASLAALTLAATEKGYSLVGCNCAGNNAYYVRTDLLECGRLTALSVADAFIDARFRESRNENDELSFARGAKRLSLIAGMTVVNTVTGESETL